MSASRWRLVIAVSVANGLAWLNVSELTPALPKIQRAFDATLPELQWISSLLFTLALPALLIVAGRLGDVHGHRRDLGFGLLFFSAASVVAALAPDAELLIVARGLQGVGAAVLLSIIPATLTQRRRWYFVLAGDAGEARGWPGV